MAEIKSNTNNTYYAILTVNETDNFSIIENYREVYYELYLYNGVQNFSGYTIGHRVNIDNSEVAYQDNSGNQTSMNANSRKLIASGTKRIYHNEDGTKRNIPISFEIWTNNYSYLPVSLSASGSMNLTDIPRNVNFTEHYVESTGLNSITVRWGADDTVGQAYFSINGGGWTPASYPTYMITGLAPNTTYNIRTKINRENTDIWTESDYIYGTTKDIAKVTSASNFNLGDNPKINISNPSGESINYFIETLNPTKTVLERRAVAGENIIELTQEELDTIYKKMGTTNATSIRFGVATKGSYWHWLDRTCTLTGNQKTGHPNVNGAYKRAKGWTNVMGNWKRKVRWINVNGTWKRCI